MLKRVVKGFFNCVGLEIRRANSKIIKPIDVVEVEILNDQRFQESIKEVKNKTLLDTPRLANLWQLCSLSDPNGAILEIGCYRGGASLHLSNCCPDRKIYLCDSFQGFESLNKQLDVLFKLDMFLDITQKEVNQLFQARNRDYEILAGFFPSSCQGKTLPPVSFVHLDVDVYKATKESLDFLAPLMMSNSFIVLDDYNRNANGVNQAVLEFLAEHPNWRVLPMFPSQGVLFPLD